MSDGPANGPLALFSLISISFCSRQKASTSYWGCDYCFSRAVRYEDGSGRVHSAKQVWPSGRKSSRPRTPEAIAAIFNSKDFIEDCQDRDLADVFKGVKGKNDMRNKVDDQKSYGRRHTDLSWIRTSLNSFFVLNWRTVISSTNRVYV